MNGTSAQTMEERYLGAEALDRRRPRSVLQEWVMNLTMMQQSVLLTALRGPDGVAKDHISKKVVRWLRRCVLLSAFDRVPLTDPMDPRGGSFTGPSITPATGVAWPLVMNTEVISPYIRSCDELPHHFQSHIRNAAEVLGYKHPDPTIREFWFAFYLRIAKDAHMNPETEEQMDFRLADNREQWIAAGDISSCGREECEQ